MPPPHYNVDRNRVRLGQGEAVFARAARAIRDWRMLRMAYPLSRRLQKRFARDSLAAMVDAVAEK